MKELSNRVLQAHKELSKDSYRGYNTTYEDGTLTSITISQTLLSTLSHKNDDKEFCPEYINEVFIKGTPMVINEYMLRGLYFEQVLIGNSVKEKRYELPKLLNGGLSTNEKRIIQQIESFPLICNLYGIIIKKDKSNCQVEKTALYDTIDGVKVYIKGKSDIISPIDFGGVSEIAVLDLKLTGDLNNKFYWGNPNVIDTIQAQMYSTLFQLPFYFFVFEYKNTLGHKIFPVITRYSSNEQDKAEGMIRQRELFERIRSAAIILIDIIRNGTERIPNTSNCKMCPLALSNGGDCIEYQKINKL